MDVAFAGHRQASRTRFDSGTIAALGLLPLELEGLKLELAGVLADGAHGCLGQATLGVGSDFEDDLDLGVAQVVQVLDHLVGNPLEPTRSALSLTAP